MTPAAPTLLYIDDDAGLAHVRALVRRLGGTMSVASELHQGSTFTVTLPIQWNTNNRNRET